MLLPPAALRAVGTPETAIDPKRTVPSVRKLRIKLDSHLWSACLTP